MLVTAHEPVNNGIVIVLIASWDVIDAIPEALTTEDLASSQSGVLSIVGSHALKERKRVMRLFKTNLSIKQRISLPNRVNTLEFEMHRDSCQPITTSSGGNAFTNDHQSFKGCCPVCFHTMRMMCPATLGNPIVVLEEARLTARETPRPGRVPGDGDGNYSS